MKKARSEVTILGRRYGYVSKRGLRPGCDAHNSGSFAKRSTNVPPMSGLAT